MCSTMGVMIVDVWSNWWFEVVDGWLIIGIKELKLISWPHFQTLCIMDDLACRDASSTRHLIAHFTATVRGM
jgi:hypothetical protein